MHTGVAADKVGPGDYQVDVKRSQKGPTKWVKPDLSEKIKEIKQKKVNAQPGPGTYEAPNSAVNPIYKNNKSSVFASRVPRAQSSTQAGKQRHRVVNKGQVSQSKYQAIAEAAKSPTAGAINDILESDDDEEGPGPGQYFHGQQSSFKPETKPQRLQFFGSTVERFTDQNRFKASEEVGPGTYAPAAQSGFAGKGSTKNASHKGRDNVCFASGQARFAGSHSTKAVGGSRGQMQQLSGQKIVTPGPGQYDDGITLASQVMKRTAGNKKAFNCEEKRQPEYNMQETPGPGQYAQNQDLKREEIKRSSSMFISKTKRNTTYNQIVKKSSQNPGLGKVCNDDHAKYQNTIADQSRKKIESINNPVLA